MAELEKAVKILVRLKEALDWDRRNQIIIVSMRYYRVKRAFTSGLISRDTRWVEETEVASIVLELLDEIE